MAAYAAAGARVRSGRSNGYTAVKHQSFVGTGYFDAVTHTVAGSKASTTALTRSTEDEQFFDKGKNAA